MEADLRRFFHVSRHDLPLIEVWHLLKHLPAEAILSGNDGWSISDLLLADVVTSLTGQPHPSDPREKRKRVRIARDLREVSTRSAARRAALGIKGSVLRRRG